MTDESQVDTHRDESADAVEVPPTAGETPSRGPAPVVSLAARRAGARPARQPVAEQPDDGPPSAA